MLARKSRTVVLEQLFYWSVSPHWRLALPFWLRPFVSHWIWQVQENNRVRVSCLKERNHRLSQENSELKARLQALESNGFGEGSDDGQMAGKVSPQSSLFSITVALRCRSVSLRWFSKIPHSTCLKGWSSFEHMDYTVTTPQVFDQQAKANLTPLLLVPQKLLGGS